MTRSREEPQKMSFAMSGVLLLLLALGYLFVPREDLGNRSPLATLALMNRNFECVGGTNSGLSGLIEARKSESICEEKYNGRFELDVDRSWGWSDVGSLISKDLPSTLGLFFLLGASPAIGFLVFQRISGTRSGTTTQKTNPPPAKDEKPAASAPPKLVPKELADRLEHLQSLHQKGLITSEEFSIKKKELLEEI